MRVSIRSFKKKMSTLLITYNIYQLYIASGTLVASFWWKEKSMVAYTTNRCLIFYLLITTSLSVGWDNMVDVHKASKFRIKQ